MKSVCFVVTLALAFAAGCSDAQCGENQRKIGNVCRRVPRADGGIDERPSGEQRTDAGASAGSDANAVDAGRELDASVASEEAGASPFEAGATPDADAVETDAAMGPSGPAAPVCGDGVQNGTELCDPRVTAGQPGACPTEESCESADACLIARVVGDADQCTARCETEPQRACVDGDECCPSGCTSGTDDDCSATCGNKYLDANEACEVGVGAGCPTSCPAANGCNAFMLTGDAKGCSAKCVPIAITALTAGDSCCPAGATAKTDADCAGCGNKKLESGELCDGNCPTTCDDGDPCTVDSNTGSADACNFKCVHTPVAANHDKTDGLCCGTATAKTDLDCPGCGNEKVESGEICDGNCPSTCDDGNPCTTDSSSGSANSCNLKCSHTAVAANKDNADGLCCPGFTFAIDKDCPGCGNGAVDAGEQCDDGNATNNDGCSTSCQLDDNLATWGDDRPGFFLCGGTTCNARQMCWVNSATSPPTFSCIEPSNIGTRSRCDGPEDCPSGQSCAAGQAEDAVVLECVPSEQLLPKPGTFYDSYIYCHTDADCIAPKRCGVNGPGGGSATFPGTAWCGPLIE